MASEGLGRVSARLSIELQASASHAWNEHLVVMVLAELMGAFERLVDRFEGGDQLVLGTQSWSDA
jgi:hypothetical protein